MPPAPKDDEDSIIADLIKEDIDQSIRDSVQSYNKSMDQLIALVFPLKDSQLEAFHEYQLNATTEAMQSAFKKILHIKNSRMKEIQLHFEAAMEETTSIINKQFEHVFANKQQENIKIFLNTIKGFTKEAELDYESQMETLKINFKNQEDLSRAHENCNGNSIQVFEGRLKEVGIKRRTFYNYELIDRIHENLDDLQKELFPTKSEIAKNPSTLDLSNEQENMKELLESPNSKGKLAINILLVIIHLIPEGVSKSLLKSLFADEAKYSRAIDILANNKMLVEHQNLIFPSLTAFTKMHGQINSKREKCKVFLDVLDRLNKSCHSLIELNEETKLEALYNSDHFILTYLLPSVKWEPKIFLTFAEKTAWRLKDYKPESSAKIMELVIQNQRTLVKDALQGLTILASQNKLSFILILQGLPKECLKLCNNSLSEFESKLGKSHQLILECRFYMADAFYTLEMMAQAFKIYRKIIKNEGQVMGSKLQRKFAGRMNHEKGTYDDEIIILVKALDMQDKILPHSHPSTTRSITRLASILFQTKHLEDAIWFYEEALKRQNEDVNLSSSHPRIVETMKCLADTLFDQENYEKSLEYYRRVLEAKEKAEAGNFNDEQKVVEVKNKIGKTLLILERFTESTEIFSEILGIQERRLGIESQNVLSIKASIAFATVGSGTIKEGLKMLQEVLSAQKRVLGWDHKDVLKTGEYVKFARKLFSKSGPSHI